MYRDDFKVTSLSPLGAAVAFCQVGVAGGRMHGCEEELVPFCVGASVSKGLDPARDPTAPLGDGRMAHGCAESPLKDRF